MDQIRVLASAGHQSEDAMNHLVVEVTVFLISLQQLGLQGLAGPLCALQGCTSLFPLADQ